MTQSRFKKIVISMGAVTLVTSLAFAQTRPTTQDAQDKFDRLIGTGTEPTPLKPQPSLATDTTGANAVAPGAPQQQLKREGTYLVDRVGRLTKAGDAWEFNLDSDGQALLDPPLKVLPNLKLMLMEDQIAATSRDLRFRITGMITEYRGRNCVLIEKVVVLNEDERPF